MPWANNDRQEIFPGGSWHVRDSTLQKQDILDLGHSAAAKSQHTPTDSQASHNYEGSWRQRSLDVASPCGFEENSKAV